MMTPFFSQSQSREKFTALTCVLCIVKISENLKFVADGLIIVVVECVLLWKVARMKIFLS